MKCAYPLCGKEFSAVRSNQKYCTAQHRKKDSNRRWPVKRQKDFQAVSRNGLGKRQEEKTSYVTLLPGGRGTEIAQTKQQRRNQAMRKQQSSELLSPLQVARFLAMSTWALLLWRKKRFGPPFLKVTRKTIRYPRPELEEWLASLRPTA